MSLWTSAGRWVPSNSFFLWLLREAKTAVHPLAGLGALPFWLAFCFNVFQMRTECWNTSANVSSSCVGGVLQWHHAVPLLYNQHLAPFLTERIGAKRGKQFSVFQRGERQRREHRKHFLPCSTRTSPVSQDKSLQCRGICPPCYSSSQLSLLLGWHESFCRNSALLTHYRQHTEDRVR